MNTCPICNATATYVYCSLSCSNKARVKKNEVKYYLQPKLCQACGKAIQYAKRYSNRFCSSSCSASLNNLLRPRKTKALKPKSDKSMIKFESGELITRSSIRKVLIKLYGAKCKVCSNPATWLDKPLTLIVDHINGNAGDNHPSNLRLLCPNCNSQSPTFSGRNKGRGRKALGLHR